MSIAVQIPQFEGPLGLLLYLIRKEEMDIFDIDIHLITSQYLEYIKKMKQFDLEVAGDFIAMAATLIQIKSKMLLPNYNEDGEEEEALDPRKELVQRLIEYQKFQEISKDLYGRPLLGRDVYKRGKTESIHSDEDGEIIIDEGGLFALIGLYRGAIRKMKKVVHRVAKKTQSIAGRILEIKDRLVVGRRVILRDLLDNLEEIRSQLLVTFLSSLELGKMGYLSVYQSEVYGDIYLTAKKPIEGNVVERVEEYDSQNSEEIADRITGDLSIDDDDEDEDDDDIFAASQPDESFAATDEEIRMAEEELNIEEDDAVDFEAIEKVNVEFGETSLLTIDEDSAANLDLESMARIEAEVFVENAEAADSAVFAGFEEINIEKLLEETSPVEEENSFEEENFELSEVFEDNDDNLDGDQA